MRPLPGDKNLPGYTPGKSKPAKSPSVGKTRPRSLTSPAPDVPSIARPSAGFPETHSDVTHIMGVPLFGLHLHLGSNSGRQVATGAAIRRSLDEPTNFGPDRGKNPTLPAKGRKTKGDLRA